MGAKISAEMLKARRLIVGGMTAYAAAIEAGITRGAISKSKWYQDFIKKSKGKKK